MSIFSKTKETLIKEISFITGFLHFLHSNAMFSSSDHSDNIILKYKVVGISSPTYYDGRNQAVFSSSMRVLPSKEHKSIKSVRIKIISGLRLIASLI